MSDTATPVSYTHLDVYKRQTGRVDSAVDLMRAKHKNGEEFYWLLYYAYLSPQELQNVEEIIDQLRPHIRDISTRTYYRKRKEAVEVLSSVLWGYTAQDSAGIVREFCGQ